MKLDASVPAESFETFVKAKEAKNLFTPFPDCEEEAVDKLQKSGLV